MYFKYSEPPSKVLIIDWDGRVPDVIQETINIFAGFGNIVDSLYINDEQLGVIAIIYYEEEKAAEEAATEMNGTILDDIFFEVLRF